MTQQSPNYSYLSTRLCNFEKLHAQLKRPWMIEAAACTTAKIEYRWTCFFFFLFPKKNKNSLTPPLATPPGRGNQISGQIQFSANFSVYRHRGRRKRNKKRQQRDRLSKRNYATSSLASVSLFSFFFFYFARGAFLSRGAKVRLESLARCAHDCGLGLIFHVLGMKSN